MLKQASSTPLAPICNFNRSHHSLSWIQALSRSSLGTPLGLGGAQHTSQAGLRLRLIRSFATKHPLAPGGLTCRPRLLPMPASGQSVVETLQAIEARWVASMQPSSRGTARLSSEVSASLPAWMTPSQTPRAHWSDR
ncbi:TPA: hypothetical protein ACH3X2_005372 [Trebouxia sp. C0005]